MVGLVRGGGTRQVVTSNNKKAVVAVKLSTLLPNRDKKPRMLPGPYAPYALPKTVDSRFPWPIPCL
jgi:hypothetical protein